MSEENKDKKGPGPARNKRPHSKNYKGKRKGPNKGPQGATKQAAGKPSPEKQSHANENSNRSEGQKSAAANKKSNSRNRRPKSMTPARVLQKYDNLLEQYLIGRKKFFEMKGKVVGKQLQKIEANWQKTLKSLRDFEINISGWQKDTLDQKVNFYPEDRTYTTNNEIDPAGDEVELTGDFLDEHYLAKQVAASDEYKDDKEESMGSMDDYKAYKGISE